jgi:tetratricopeptide (TPR) repeat protein
MATTTVEPKTDTVTPTPSAARPARTGSGPKRGLLFAGAAIAVLAGGWVVFSSGGRKEAFAQRELERARAVAEGGNLPAASSQFQRIIESYRGTDAAGEAVIALNQARLVNGQSELAVVNLREFLATDPEPALATPAYGLLGTALENSRKPAEAAEAYRQAAQSATASHLKAEYLVDAGRALALAGKPEEAKVVYAEVIGKFGGTGSETEAKVRYAELSGGTLPVDSAASTGPGR